MVRLIHPRAPSERDFSKIYSDICERGVFTNNGYYLDKFEKSLCEFTGLDDLVIVNNGTSALMLALIALELTGSIITTPFTFAATANSIALTKAKIYFGGVDGNSFNLEPDNLSDEVVAQSSAILGVLCYGNTYGAKKLENIASQNAKPMIFDAAHAFGKEDTACKSVLRLGTLSVTSFHATKVLSSIEGGAIYSSDTSMMNRIRSLRNFGLTDAGVVEHVGFNAKMSELHAAVGLLNLRYLQDDIIKRCDVAKKYDQALHNSKCLRSALVHDNDFSNNGAYYPIVFQSSNGGNIESLMRSLENSNVQFRRYFYPALTEHPVYNNLHCEIDDSIKRDMQNIICLPIHPFLTSAEIDLVCKVLEEY
jgi:dTDP-4-amino-4,6-dideoxygalactose transaminase